MELLRWLAEYRSDVMDKVFLFISEIATETLAILIICLIFWCIKKKTGLTIAFGWFLTAILVQGMKIIFRVERPWILDPDFQAVAGAVSGAGGYSFPSGHTQSAFAIYGALGLMQKKWYWKVSWFALAVLVGFSRMYLGVHTLWDVLTSAVLCICIVLFIKKIWEDKEFSLKNLNLVCWVILGLSLALVILAVALNLMGLITPDYIRDACKVAGSGTGFALAMFVESNHADDKVRPKTVWGGILRLVTGLVGVVAIQTVTGLPAIKSIAASLIGYCLLTFWVGCLFPMIVRYIDDIRGKVVE